MTIRVPQGDTPVLTREQDLFKGIGLKIVSVAFFVVMATLLKATETVPAGEMVFFRSFFALLPVLAYLVWKRRLADGFRTTRPFGHLLRGLVGVASMGCGFFALTRLPLPEATAIGYASPLLIVALSAILLKEKVHVFRWTAVCVGLLGVLVILWPRLTVFTGGAALENGAAIGALAAICGAFLTAVALMQVRQLVSTERTEAIVTYFFISASALALFSMPFGWIWPSPQQAAMLIGAGIFGGIAQLLMTSSYRYADMSVIAPFEYVSLLLTIGLGFFIFGDLPTIPMLIGAAIIMGSGIAIILREHYLGLDRRRDKEAGTL